MNSLITKDIIKAIVANHPEISFVKIHDYPTPTGIEERIPFGEIEYSHFNEALNFRKHTQIGFWDSLMISFFDRESISDNILANMITHHAKRKKILVPREDILGNGLEQFLTSEANFAINSEVICSDGKKRHIILLDFHIPASERNQKVVESLLKAFKLEGYLMSSGKSYHFIGKRVVTIRKLNDILYRSLFYSPIIDKYWVAHQLMDRSCSLRISKKHGLYPQLIKTVSQ